MSSYSVAVSFLLVLEGALWAGDPPAFVRVSPRDPRYLELSDGRPYVPIGLNLISPNTREADGLARMEEWLAKLSANGGNYIRVWISSPFWDVEAERSGAYSEAKAQRIDALLELARRYGLRVKLTLEHFREMNDNPRQRWANKPLHLVANGGTATNMADFFAGEPSRTQFKAKLAWLAKRYADNSSIFGVELWNEVNAVRARPEEYMPWTQTMLAELHRRFPHHLALQSLGSYDSTRYRDLYRQHSRMAGNDLAQVHRYLDLGASLEICHGPMDLLAADAVRDLLSFDPHRPVLLAESGAVEPRHSGPFKLYARDKEGILLHDVVFSPFFTGAAGGGQIWHWDVYVDRNNLWWQFGRFAEAVKDFDPAAEGIQPLHWVESGLRVYALKGRHTSLLWCHDTQNNWQTELEQGQPPRTVTQATLHLATVIEATPSPTARVYDPWKNRWSEMNLRGDQLELPTFSRSIVVRLVRP